MSFRFGWKKIFRFSELNEAFYSDLEERLIQSDVGGKNALAILQAFRDKVKAEKITERDAAVEALKDILTGYVLHQPLEVVPDKLNVWIIIGINGVGKTTTIAKLANHYGKNRKIILGAGDTFRAAAREQLEAWAERLHLFVIGQPAGSDAASVAYDTIHAALARGSEIALIDTAGRLHNKDNLVDQLGKLIRVTEKFADKIVRKNLLVLDATLGQSGVEQVKSFKEKVGVDGIILTKLDTQAKGGAVLNVSQSLQVPVTHVGYGERVADFAEFDPKAYVDSLV